MLEIRNTFYFSDTSDALMQVEEAFGRASGAAPIRLGLIGTLAISIRLNNPLAGDLSPGRGRYDASSQTYSVEANADYDQWISTDWWQRTEAYAAAMKDAIGRVAKTRLPDAERTGLLSHVDRLQESVTASQPDRLKALKPVMLICGEDGATPAIGFDVASPIGVPVSAAPVLVPPETAAAVATSLSTGKPPEPQAFKLYRRDGEAMHYHEAWVRDAEIVEHWGHCGHEGHSLRHPYDSLISGGTIMQAIRHRARGAGFSPLPQS